MAELMNETPVGISRVEESVSQEDPDEIVVFPPHGFIRLVEWMGSESAIVNAARVSLAREIDEADALSDGDHGLLRFLLKRTSMLHNQLLQSLNRELLES